MTSTYLEKGTAVSRAADRRSFELGVVGEDAEKTVRYVSLLQHRSSSSRHATQSKISASDTKASSICLYGHAVPSLYLLGPQKSGTSTIANEWLDAGIKSAYAEKPFSNITYDQPEKELHSFDSICKFNIARRKHASSSERCMPMTKEEKEIWAQHFHSCTHKQHSTLADMTPVNLRLPGLATMMADLYGESKSSLRFVILLRNPVERLHSGFWHEKWFDPNLRTMDFTSWLKEVVIPKAEAIKTSGSWAGIETNYDMDQFYRSLVSLQLKQWLEVFEPSQFMLIPMSEYFVNETFRVEAFWQLKKKWGITLDETYPLDHGARHDNVRPHPSLEQYANTAVIKKLNSEFFHPDAAQLANLLAKAMPRGLTLSGYVGRPGSVPDIEAFLRSVDYPTSAQ